MLLPQRISNICMNKSKKWIKMIGIFVIPYNLNSATLHQYDQIIFGDYTYIFLCYSILKAALFTMNLQIIDKGGLDRMYFETGIEPSSAESQIRENLKCTQDITSAANPRYERQQRRFNNFANHYHHLVEQYHELIEELIRQLQQDGSQHASLIMNLKKCLMRQATKLAFITDETMKDLLSVIKRKMEFSFKKLDENEMGFYQSVLKDNIKLSQFIKKQWNIIQEWTIQKLYNLDMLSIFFGQSLSFLRKCASRHIPLTKEVVSYLFGFSNKEAIKLLKIYRDSHTFISEINDRHIHQMVHIYHILLLRNRMYFIAKKAVKKRIDQTQYYRKYYNQSKKALKESKQLVQYQKVNILDIRYYNFCQITFWSTSRRIQQQPYAIRIQIARHIQEANRQKNPEILSKALLFIKIKNNISFQSIFQFSKLIAEKNVAKIKELLYESKMSKTADLQEKLPYIFVKDDNFDDAFEKSGLSKKYDLKSFDRLLVSRMQSIYTFVRVAYRQSRQLSVLLHNMLKMQLNHKRELIVIKKLTISFGEIAGIQSDKPRSQKQDLLCNLILITSQDRILSFCIVRDVLRDQKYYRILKRIIKDVRIKPGSAILLYQSYIGQLPQERSFYRFYFLVLKNYRLHTYVTNTPLYCKLVLLTFSYVKMRILSKRQYITQCNFYEIVETQIIQALKRLMMTKFKFIN